MRRIRLVTIGLGLFVAACPPEAKLGDRAAAGACPANETCSDEVPNGLQFSGNGPESTGIAWSDGPPFYPTAYMGHQTLTLKGVRVVSQTSGCSSENDATSEEPLGEFRAVAAGTAIEIGPTGNSTVVVRGAQVGSAKLRILEADSELLIDQTTLHVLPVERVEVVPKVWCSTSGQSVAVWTESTGQYLVRIDAAEGESLIDEGVGIDTNGTVAGKSHWSVFDVTAPKDGVLEVAAHASDGTAGRFEAPVIGAVTAVTFETGLFHVNEGPPPEIPVGTAGAVACFHASFNELRVLWAPWLFEASENVRTFAFDDGCVVMEPVADGVGWVRGTVGGLSAQVAIVADMSSLYGPVDGE